MNPEAELYRRLSEIFAAARSLAGEERRRLLDARCGDDPVLRARAEELLAASDDDDARDPLSEAEIQATRRELQSGGTDWIPERVDGYRILRRIGEGGMGVVYEAQQASPRRRVAIKLLHPLYATAERVRRFRQEAELLGRLRHPGIAEIFEAGIYDLGRGSQPYFAMELIEGLDLRSHCDKHALDTRARLDLLARICDAVQFAHGQGVIHRDLKPDNVLVDGHGQPKVLDFGIARAAKSSTVLSTIVTEAGQIVGTLGYMAPEQLRQSTEQVSAQADVYALGVMGFELLTHRLPHQIADLPISAAVTLLATTDAPRAGTIVRALRGEIETILGTALASEPTRRYESPAAFAADLRRHLDHLPIRARPPSRIYTLRKLVRRNLGISIGVAATTMALAIGLIVAISLRQAELDQRIRADDAAHESRRNEILLLANLNERTRTALDRREYWTALRNHELVREIDRDWAWRLRLLRMPESLPLRVDVAAATGEPTPDPAGPLWQFVDDHRLIAVDGSRGEALVVYDVDARAERVLFAGLGLRALGMATPTGFVVALGTNETLLLDVNREAVVQRWPTSVVRSIEPGSVSDDGRVVLVHPDATSSQVFVDGVLRHSIACPMNADEHAMIGSRVAPDGSEVFVNWGTRLDVLEVATERVRSHEPADGYDRIHGFGVEGGWLSYQWDSADLRKGAVRLQRGHPAVLKPWSGSTARHRLGKISATRDGRFVALGAGPGCYLFDSSDGAPGRLHPDQDDTGYLPIEMQYWAYNSVAPSGGRLLVQPMGQRPWLFELELRRLLPGFDARCAIYREHSGVLYHLALSPDGCLIATAGPREASVRVWDARTLETVAVLERSVHEELTRDAFLAFDASGERLVMTTAMPDRVGVGVVEWQLLCGERNEHWPDRPHEHVNHAALLDVFLERLAPLPGARLSQRAQMLRDEAWTTWPSLAWDAPPADLVGERWRFVPDLANGGREQVVALAAHPDLDVVAVASIEVVAIGAINDAPGFLTLRRAADGGRLAECRLPFRAWSMAWAPDGSCLAVSVGPGEIVIVDAEHFIVRDRFPGHAAYGSAMAWMPDGERLVTASGDRTARVFDSRPLAVRDAERAAWIGLRRSAATRLAAGDAEMRGNELERAAMRVERIRRAHRR